MVETNRSGALAMLFVFTAHLAFAVDLEALDPVEAPRPAPTLELQDLGDRTHQLEDYRDQVVLVNFWASWCAPCMVEMPGMQRLQDRLGRRGLKILAVNAGESRSAVWQARNTLGIRFPLLLDEGRHAVQTWDVKVFPSSFLVDGQGRIRHRITGMLDWNSPEAAVLVEELLKELPRLEVAKKKGG